MENNKHLEQVQELTNQLVMLEKDEEAVLTKKEQLLIVNDIFDKVKALDDEVTRLGEMKASVRDKITAAMRENYNGVNDVFEIDSVRIKYTPPTTRKTVNTTALKAGYPDVYNAVLKESPVKDRVTITFKEVKEALPNDIDND